MSALLWSVATSYFTLGTLAIVTLVALVVGFAPLVRFLPVVGPYVPLAKFVFVLGAGVLCFISGARFADNRAELATLQAQVERQNRAAEQDRAKADADAATLQRYDARMRDLEQQISSGVCLPDADADRLRQLWGK